MVFFSHLLFHCFVFYCCCLWWRIKLCVLPLTWDMTTLADGVVAARYLDSDWGPGYHYGLLLTLKGQGCENHKNAASLTAITPPQIVDSHSLQPTTGHNLSQRSFDCPILMTGLLAVHCKFSCLNAEFARVVVVCWKCFITNRGTSCTPFITYFITAHCTSQRAVCHYVL